ncbi:MAG TPA: hydrogenase-4 component E, partial [Alphaproteobacteria bacterium]|nr:hydrogenase-4 component E [Alphaproteobacteria bacterium]
MTPISLITDYDVARALAAGVLVFSFILLSQRRLFSLLANYGGQALVLAAATAWQAYVQQAPQLYITAAITLVFKAIVIPV